MSSSSDADMSMTSITLSLLGSGKSITESESLEESLDESLEEQHPLWTDLLISEGVSLLHGTVGGGITHGGAMLYIITTWQVIVICVSSTITTTAAAITSRT